MNSIKRKNIDRYQDREDLDYHGLRDTENVFDNIDEDYYKPISVKSSFDESYKYYKSRGDKDKKLSIKQYLKRLSPIQLI